MEKYSFLNDYSDGGHPAVLKALAESSAVAEVGYGLDSLCAQAEHMLRRELNSETAQIHFVTGGTQANLVVLAALLRPFEAVICADTGHINIHEAGAIEATGHKILGVPCADGKLTAESIEEVCRLHTDEHMVSPRVVFLSNATELGTIYRRDELRALAEVCRAHGLLLYIDGARLGAALTAQESDVTLSFLPSIADVFYIGGTKNGALFGEAVVFSSPSLATGFRQNMKQRGALLAKSRALGAQFCALFESGLWYELATHGNEFANRLAEGISALGYRFLVPPCTNQVFPILPNPLLKHLHEHYLFYDWKGVSCSETAVRLVTSWHTSEVAVTRLLEDLSQAHANYT